MDVFTQLTVDANDASIIKNIALTEEQAHDMCYEVGRAGLPFKLIDFEGFRKLFGAVEGDMMTFEQSYFMGLIQYSGVLKENK